MKLASLSFSSVLLLSSVITWTSGAVINSNKIRSGNENVLPYQVVNPMFTGIVDGNPYEIEGSANEVNAKLAALYPGYSLANATTATKLLHSPKENPNKLSTRAKILPPACFNRGDWKSASFAYIEYGTRKMRRMGGSFSVGSKSCARIWCGKRVRESLNAAEIWLCNDNDRRIAPSVAYLASYVEDVIWQCRRKDVTGDWVVTGQFFDTDYYNVVVKGQSRAGDVGACDVVPLSGRGAVGSPLS